MKIRQIRLIGQIGLIGLMGFIGPINSIQAQTAPQFMVSWRAQSSAPAWYSGKIFPTKDTPVEISFELIDNGKLSDISKNAVRWYVNDKLVKNENDGFGIKYLRFIAVDYPGQDAEIRISIPSYKNFGPLDKIIRIPVVKPQAVIVAPYYNKTIAAGKSVFEVIPFFFSVKDLEKIRVNWLIDGKPSDVSNENLRILELNVPSEMPKGTIINIKATAKNSFKEMEFANGNLDIKVK